MTKNEEFLSKLKALLKEYNATISFDVGEGSDTHGLYEEEMVISFQMPNFVEEEVLTVPGWCISHEYL